MRCKQHREYKGILKPKTTCIACWCVYIEKHFREIKKVITIDEMESLIESMGSECTIEKIQNSVKLDD